MWTDSRTETIFIDWRQEKGLVEPAFSPLLVSLFLCSAPFCSAVFWIVTRAAVGSFWRCHFLVKTDALPPTGPKMRLSLSPQGEICCCILLPATSYTLRYTAGLRRWTKWLQSETSVCKAKTSIHIKVTMNRKHTVVTVKRGLIGSWKKLSTSEAPCLLAAAPLLTLPPHKNHKTISWPESPWAHSGLFLQ